MARRVASEKASRAAILQFALTNGTKIAKPVGMCLAAGACSLNVLLGRMTPPPRNPDEILRARGADSRPAARFEALSPTEREHDGWDIPRQSLLKTEGGAKRALDHHPQQLARCAL